MKKLRAFFRDRNYQLYGLLIVLSGLGLLALDVYLIFGFSARTDENLIALLFLRKDNIQRTLRAEIFPIARYLNGKYEDASVMTFESQRTADMEQRSFLNRFRDFSVYQDSKRVGAMKVKGLEWGMFQCLHGVVGLGDFKLDIEPDFSRGTSARASYADGREFSYSLTWYSALAKSFRANFKETAIAPGIEKALIALARQEFSKDGISAPSDLRPTETKLFDLDVDGIPEAIARFEIPQKDGLAYLLMVTRLGHVPLTLLSLFGKEAEGSWGRGYTFIDVVDVNDDGVAEVLIRFAGWEVVEFLIYELRNKSLQQVFRGAQYGC
jgi:hypothetical protein